MPYSVTWEARGVLKSFWGHLSSDDFLAAHRRITEDHRFGKLVRYVISDFSGVESVNVSPDVLQMYCGERNGTACYVPNISGAMVATTSAALRLCAQITSDEYATPYEMCLFETVDEARAWLKC